MTVKDWASLAMLLIAAAGIVANVAVSIAIARRDREDFIEFKRETEERCREQRKELDDLRRELHRWQLGERS